MSRRLTYRDGLLTAQQMANDAMVLCLSEGRTDAADALSTLSTDLLAERQADEQIESEILLERERQRNRS